MLSTAPQTCLSTRSPLHCLGRAGRGGAVVDRRQFRVEVADVESAMIEVFFRPAAGFIIDALGSSPDAKVLVHCHAGNVCADEPLQCTLQPPAHSACRATCTERQPKSYCIFTTLLRSATASFLVRFINTPLPAHCTFQVGRAQPQSCWRTCWLQRQRKAAWKGSTCRMRWRPSRKAGIPSARTLASGGRCWSLFCIY